MREDVTAEIQKSVLMHVGRNCARWKILVLAKCSQKHSTLASRPACFPAINKGSFLFRFPLSIISLVIYTARPLGGIISIEHQQRQAITTARSGNHSKILVPSTQIHQVLLLILLNETINHKHCEVILKSHAADPATVTTGLLRAAGCWA